MDLKYNGVYRLIEMDIFTLPNSIDDLPKVKQILTALFKVKVSLHKKKNERKK